MFFFLSKTLGYLVQPLVIVCLLLVLSLVLKKVRLKKIMAGTGIGLLLFFSNDFIAHEAIRVWEVAPIPFAEITKQYTWGIVLTGITKSDVGPADRVYFQRGADRATHTVQLYKEGYIKKILISGGSGRLLPTGIKEADELAMFMQMAGVPTEDIVLENESVNTYQSAVNTIAQLKSVTTPTHCLLITSGYHLPRARACFFKQGWAVDVFAAEPLARQRNFHLDTLIVPKLDAIGLWHTLFKECTGMLMYKLMGYA
jgi:uncharacterized SAM-binding protein YcdF (DUF218 family)